MKKRSLTNVIYLWGVGGFGFAVIRFLGEARTFAFLDALPPSCPFKILTGLPCAFCGMTHAFLHAAFFQWREADRCNALSLPLLGGGIALLMALSLGFKLRPTPRARRIWTGLGAGILVAYAVIRSL